MFTSSPFRVYIADTDVAGVVHHAQYIRYFEAGRIEYLRHLGHPYQAYQDAGIGFVPVHIAIHFHRPLRPDDEFVVTVAPIECGHASFTVRQTIQHPALPNHPPHVTATIKLACVQEPSFQPLRLPKDLRHTIKTNESRNS